MAARSVRQWPPMSSARPLSIVIPTFNTAAMTLSCCRAAMAAAPDAEILVADDASTDGTAELLRAEVPEIVTVRLETNRRFAGAANVGVAASTGRIVLLLNTDAVLDRTALEALLAAFREDEQLGIAGARLVHPDGTPQWSGGPLPTLLWLAVMVNGSARFFPRRRSPTRETASVAWVSGAAMAFRRETWEAAGPFRESYLFYAQDLEFCARAGAKGWGVRIVENARVVHGGGATMRRWREVEELPHDPTLLWLDLMTWGRRHYGRTWAQLAFPVVCAAASLRIAMRRLLRSPRSGTEAYAAALRQLLVERKQLTGKSVAAVARHDEPAAGLADSPRP